MSDTRRWRALGLGSALLTIWAPAAAMAQTVPQPAPATTARGIAVPATEVLMILIRTTLIALNHANRTGNYAVFRDLAAPSFQTANNPARLAQIFADLRSRDLDLSPILIVSPQLSTPPVITEQAMLHLRGRFPTQPVQIEFELLFQPVAGDWRLFGISVQPRDGPDIGAPKAGEAKIKPEP